MDIISATFKNLDDIAKLYVHNHKTTYKGLLSDEYLNSLTVEGAKARWSDYLNNDKNKIWVVFDNDIFIAFAAGTEDPEIENTWYLDSLHVSENARGRGVGTALVESMGRYAAESGYEAMSICVVKGNVNAENLYTKLGAEPYKQFKDDFENTTSNSDKLLWKNLIIFCRSGERSGETCGQCLSVC